MEGSMSEKRKWKNKEKIRGFIPINFPFLPKLSSRKIIWTKFEMEKKQ
jgi:hypothetical protein